MASTDTNQYRYSNQNHPLTSMNSSFSSKDVKDLQLLKTKLMAVNNSASKASIYYTPPEEDNFRHSQLNLQTSPIHINYINENLEHKKLELLDLKMQPRAFLINSPLQNDSPTTVNNLSSIGDTTAALNQLKITNEHPAGSGSIEDNHYAATLADKFISTNGSSNKQRHSAFYEDCSVGDSNIELTEMSDYKDTNDVKSSKSCPVIYKVSKHNDGTTVHELLSEDLSKGLRLNKPTHEGEEQETPLHHKPQMEREKLNIILDENGKSTLYDGSVSSTKTLNGNIKDRKQLSLDLMLNANNKFDKSENTLASMSSQLLITPSTVEAYDSNRKDFDSFAYNDNIPSTSASTSASTSSSSHKFPFLASSPTSTSNNDED